ncbi:MAG TPA: MobF family relaxase [Acidimicrobiia bacterium]|nr:MobF family relaxase [Acidimicrobiia bacterium]
MLSIGKLSAASVDYYTDQLSHSVGEDVPVLRDERSNGRVDYYTDQRAPARWMGSGLGAAGVDAESPVTKEAFAQLIGHETLSGESMTRARAAHGCVAGFDHTLSAPKSVSLLYAFGDSQMREQVREAHLEAVKEAVDYMETHCAQARVSSRWRDDRGWHTSTRNVDSDGWVAAAFDHYASRANDPQLHTHVVVINRVHADDGWRALDARRNYLHAKAGGIVYETVLRDGLTRRLGVSWGPVVNGIADIEGFSPELLEHFSSRRAEILQAAEAYAARTGGRIHARMLQKFTLETRQPKQHPRGEAPVTQEMRDYGVGPDVVAHWQRRASEAPQEPAQVVRAVVGEGRHGFRPSPGSMTDSAEWIVVEATDSQPVFTRRDLLPHVSAWFPEGSTSADLADAANRVLEAAVARGEAIPLTARMPGGRWWLSDDALFTTRTQLDRERTVLYAVHDPSPVRVDPAVLDQAVKLRELTSEQGLAMKRLADMDGRLVAVAGSGGSGKTYAIGAYADAAQSAGYHVIGVSTTASAAHRLSQDLGEGWIGTIALLTHHLDQRGETLPSGSVVVCDEASMVSTKDLASLVELVGAADGKLILLGDPHQLPSIDSGGLFHRIVADGHGVVTDLAEVNQRQDHQLDREALHQLRTGNTDRAVFDYSEAGRVHIGHDRMNTMTDLVDAWWADTRARGVDTVRMLAGGRSDVNMLNHLARARMESEGLVVGPVLETRAGLEFQAGDRIVVRANWYAHADLRNGQTGTISHVDPESGQLTFRRDHDWVEVVLPRRYVEQSVDYGYAQTIHTAQGHTFGRVHVYVDQMTTAEHGYTGLSRATGETHIWMADMPGPLGDCGQLHCRPAVENQIDTLVRQLSNSCVRPAATESPLASETMTDRELLDRRDALAESFMDSPLDEPAPDIEALDQAITETRATVEDLGTSGARAQLDLLLRERDDALEVVKQRDHWIDEHSHVFDEYMDVRDEIDRRVVARTVLWQINPPDDVLAQIGSRAESPDPQAWDAAVGVYARARLEVGPDEDLLDPAPVTRKWRDMFLEPIETSAPTLKLTG